MTKRTRKPKPEVTLSFVGAQRRAAARSWAAATRSETSERARAKAAVEQQLAATRRARMELFRQSHALLQEVIVTVCASWSDSTDPATRLGAEGLEEAAAEVAHEVEAFVAANLVLVEQMPAAIDDRQPAVAVRQAAQEAFAAVLAVGQQLKVGLVHGLPVPSNVDLALTAVDHVLDGLEPFVSRTDVAMRRVLLYGEAIDSAARRAMMS